MRNRFFVLLLLLFMISNSYAERKIGKYAELTAYLDDDYNCGSNISVIVDAANKAEFMGDRINLQRLIGGVRASLGFECKGFERIDIFGRVNDHGVFVGSASASNNWALITEEEGEIERISKKLEYTIDKNENTLTDWRNVYDDFNRNKKDLDDILDPSLRPKIEILFSKVKKDNNDVLIDQFELYKSTLADRYKRGEWGNFRNLKQEIRQFSELKQYLDAADEYYSVASKRGDFLLREYESVSEGQLVEISSVNIPFENTVEIKKLVEQFEKREKSLNDVVTKFKDVAPEVFQRLNEKLLVILDKYQKKITSELNIRNISTKLSWKNVDAVEKQLADLDNADCETETCKSVLKSLRNIANKMEKKYCNVYIIKFGLKPEEIGNQVLLDKNTLVPFGSYVCGLNKNGLNISEIDIDNNWFSPDIYNITASTKKSNIYWPEELKFTTIENKKDVLTGAVIKVKNGKNIYDVNVQNIDQWFRVIKLFSNGVDDCKYTPPFNEDVSKMDLAAEYFACRNVVSDPLNATDSQLSRYGIVAYYLIGNGSDLSEFEKKLINYDKFTGNFDVIKYLKSIPKIDPTISYLIGLAYLNGTHGLEKNKHQAMNNFFDASKLGYEPAKSELAKVESDYFDRSLFLEPELMEALFRGDLESFDNYSVSKMYEDAGIKIGQSAYINNLLKVFRKFPQCSPGSAVSAFQRYQDKVVANYLNDPNRILNSLGDTLRRYGADITRIMQATTSSSISIERLNDKGYDDGLSLLTNYGCNSFTVNRVLFYIEKYGNDFLNK